MIRRPPSYPASACVHCDAAADPCPLHPGAPRYELEPGGPDYREWRREHPTSTWPRKWLTLSILLPLAAPPLEQLIRELEQAGGELVSPRLRALLRTAYSDDPAGLTALIYSVARNQRVRSPLGIVYSRLRAYSAGDANDAA